MSSTAKLAQIGTPSAREGFRASIEMMQKSARLMTSLPGSGLLCDWRELDRKFEAFRLFQYADREMKTAVDRLPVDEAVRRVPSSGSFRSIWILEGVGRIQGRVASLSAEGLLREGAGAAVPESALIPLHAGMGTAFGEKLFELLGTNPTAADMGHIVERFVEMCRANCRPGWEDATIEPLGLLVRCLYPHLLLDASAAMEAVNPDYRRLFWHGVGRSLYFVPTNFLPLPGANDRALRGAASEGARLDDRRQALAGFTWAVALVNLPRPETIASLLPIASKMSIRNEFTNGVISALMAWKHMAPADERHLIHYTRRSASRDPQKLLWENWIGPPARHALEHVFPGLLSRNRIPALYTFRSADELRELSGTTCEIEYDRQPSGRAVCGACH